MKGPHHVGIVEFALADMLSRPARYAPIVERLTIMTLNVDLSRDRVTYRVWHPSLRAVQADEVCPAYDVTVYDGRLMFSPREAAYRADVTPHSHHAAASS